MRITQVTYAKLTSLPNYENERVEYTAEVEEGECAETVLRSLKERVCSGYGDAKVQPAPDGYILFTSGGDVGEVFGSADEWLARLREVLPHSNNKRGFVNQNSSTFLRVKEEAKAKESPRAYEIVQAVEQQLAEFL